MGKKFRKSIIAIKEGLMEFLYPREGECVNCGEICNYYLCYKCKDTIKVTNCEESYGYHGGALASLIRKFKLSKDFNCGEALVELLLEKIQGQNFDDYYITFIPSTRKRIKEKGFNQSKYLAKKLSDKRLLKFQETLISNNNSKEQKLSSKQERLVNKKNSFKIKRKVAIKNRKYILVDDVKTTGATLDEGKRVLYLYGAKEVKVLTVSRSSI